MNQQALQSTINNILSEQINSNHCKSFSLKDWEDIFCLAKKLKISLLIYEILYKKQLPLPIEITTKMKESSRYALVADFKRRKQIKEIVKLFNENNIESILLKGSALINTVYQNSLSRVMSDIDLLVQKKDGEKAFNLLIKNDYSFKQSNFNCFHHFPPLFKKNALHVEIHTGLCHRYKFNISKIWQRSQNIIIDGLKTRIMSNEDQIIHIALHSLVSHYGIGHLTSLYDIAQILEIKKPRIEKIIEIIEAKEYNHEKAIFLAILLSIKKFIPKSHYHDNLPLLENKLDKYDEKLLKNMDYLCFNFSENMNSTIHYFTSFFNDCQINGFKHAIFILRRTPSDTLTSPTALTKSRVHHYLKRFWNRVRSSVKLIIACTFLLKKNKHNLQIAYSQIKLSKWIYRNTS